MILADDVKKQCRRVLADMPGESENSVGIVSRELQQKHCDAAFWMYQKYGFELDIHNLHDVIANYDFCKSVGGQVDTVVMAADIKPKQFNPKNLIEYFKTTKEKS